MNAAENLETNRQSAQRRNGARAFEQKNPARFTGLGQPSWSRAVVLPGEDLRAFQERLESWSEAAQPNDEIEKFLVCRVVCLSWKLERVERATGEFFSSLIEKVQDRELEEVERLGRHLLFDRRGPTPLYGLRPRYENESRTSWSGEIDNPDEPSVLIRQLESSRAGCRWLLARWAELRDRLDSGGFWQSYDRLKAVRLLGRQPVDAAVDQRVALIYACSDTLSLEAGTAFDDLRSDMFSADLKTFMARLRLRWRSILDVSDERKALRVLVEIVDDAIENLNIRVEAHLEHAEEYANRRAARSGVDQSPEGDHLRRQELACTRAFYRGLDALRKQQRARLDLSGLNTKEPALGTAECAVETPGLLGRSIERDGTCELDLTDSMFDWDGERENAAWWMSREEASE